MEANQVEETLNKIQQLKSIMIATATRETEIQEIEEAYIKIYKEIDLDIELFQEEGVSVSNPNSFPSLWDWYNYWSENLGNYPSRRKYIFDLYTDTIDSLECAFQSGTSHSTPNSSNSILQPEKLENLSNKIQELQTIMVDVATGASSIQAEETLYINLYQEVSKSIRKLQQVGLQIKNPNHFGSLWEWHSYWKSELSDLASRRQFIGSLYSSIVTPVQKALRKHQQKSTSIEQFIEDLRHRINEQASKQTIVSTTVNTDSAKLSKDTKAISLPAESEKALEPDSKRSVASQIAVSVPTETKIDFVIITAIKAERLAVLKAFDIDEAEDRERKGARTYWRKRLFLDDGKFYEIVVAQSLDMANVNAAILTNDTLHHWNPAAVLMVGIAATAKPETKQRLGNLVIGREVYYYETSKVTANGKLPEPKYIPVDSTLLDRVQALPASDFPILSTRPDGTHTRPEIEVGVIASGDKVIADAAERDAIAAANRKIMAIEMEGYGVISASWQSFDQVRCLVIRSLCDYADSNKHDQWHVYAAAAAAGYTKYFLFDEPLVPRNSPIPESNEQLVI